MHSYTLSKSKLRKSKKRYTKKYKMGKKTNNKKCRNTRRRSMSTKRKRGGFPKGKNPIKGAFNILGLRKPSNKKCQMAI